MILICSQAIVATNTNANTNTTYTNTYTNTTYTNTSKLYTRYTNNNKKANVLK